ncbi:hypothetical protein GPECTOR_81g183 [Gonium pectorale]|uniref:TF-B3 domain-containing protein n=1 Tax=Gonium pectorale TaxID=33097 RepID=A0A150G2J8_GONPE|nr:hypothetical protein GPECTOR_81g183 [Gonium pectorale]|eukprot:KXZ43735.1 hypothetical protein GPECTOR_81g183 [Gonium pectorale]
MDVGAPSLPANTAPSAAAGFLHPAALAFGPPSGLQLPAALKLEPGLQGSFPPDSQHLGGAGGGGGGASPTARLGGDGLPGMAAGGVPDFMMGPEAMAAALAARMAASGASIIFEKALTASDVSGGGRVVVPKSIAEQYFPKLEQPSGVTISATDLDGRTYTFKWRFWVNNSSRMYLLEGAGELHRNYGLEVGDVMVFAQKPDGSLVVAGREASKPSAGPSCGRKRKSVTPGLGVGVGVGLHDVRARIRAEEPPSLAVLDMEAPSDGVFRALVTHRSGGPVQLGVALARNNRWTATLDLAGEPYQAFFDTKEDAVEALAAAGACP